MVEKPTYEKLEKKIQELESAELDHNRMETAFQYSQANLRTFMKTACGFGVYSVKITDDQPYGTHTI